MGGMTCHVMLVKNHDSRSRREYQAQPHINHDVKQRHDRYQKLTDSETQAGWAEKMAQREKDRAEKDHRRAELQRDEDVEL